MKNLKKVLIKVISVSLLLSSFVLCSVDANAYSDWSFSSDMFPSYPLKNIDNADNLVPSMEYSGAGFYILKGTGYDLTKKFTVNKYHPDGYNNVDVEGLEEVQKKVFQTFLAWGMCPEGAAAILGNMANESGCDPTAWGPGYAWSWEDVFTDGEGEYKSHRALGQGNDSQDFGFGLIQFTSNEHIKLCFYIAGHLGKEVTDLGVQLIDLSYLMGPRNDDFEGLKTSRMFGPFYDKNDDGTNLIDYGNWGNGTYTSGDIDYGSNKNEKKISRLAKAYMCNIEVCYMDGSKERAKAAIDFYNKYKDLEPYDYGEDTKGIIGQESTGKENVVADLNTVVNEWDLTGMPKKSGLITGGKDISIVKDRSDLSVKDIYNLHEIQEARELSNQFDAYTKARVILVFFGLVLIVYGILLALSLMFDRVNTIFSFSLVTAITLGKLRYSNDLIVDEQKSEYASTKRVILSVVVLVVVGVLLITGGILPAVMKGVYAVMNWVKGVI